VRTAFLIVICLVGTACAATGPDPRARASGFASGAGVVDPYGDGKEHLIAGRYEVAIERFGQALARDRRSLDALNGLAIAHTRLGRFEVARTYFERALQVDATDAVTLNNYGWSLIEQGRLRDAKPFLELALRHAAAADLPVVAANIESMGQARPSALVAALEQGSPPGAASGQRLVRVGANVYLLKAMAGPVGGSEPATVADDAPSPGTAVRPQPAAVASLKQAPARAATTSGPAVVAGTGTADGARASAEPLGAAGSGLDMLLDPALGAAPVAIRPESEAAPIPPGEKR
jgi:tetratricopeptide (TPR) repeat protein